MWRNPLINTKFGTNNKKLMNAFRWMSDDSLSHGGLSFCLLFEKLKDEFREEKALCAILFLISTNTPTKTR